MNLFSRMLAAGGLAAGVEFETGEHEDADHAAGMFFFGAD